MKNRYDSFELDANKLARKNFTSYDIKEVLLGLQKSRKASEDNLRIAFSKAFRGTHTTDTCQAFEKLAQQILAENYSRLQCYSSKLFMPMPLQITPSKDTSEMQISATNTLNWQINCSNKLLPEERQAKEEIKLKMKERIKAAGQSHQAIESEANQLLVENLKEQLTVRIISLSYAI